jgi:spore maturation protein SpmB
MIAGLVALFMQLSPAARAEVSGVGGNAMLVAIIVAFIGGALLKKQNVFESFIEGAKEGFTTMIRVVPYLVAMLVAIGVFRNCGAMDYLVQGIAWCVEKMGCDTRFVPSLPIAFMKPLSGSGTQALTVEILANKAYGPDSFVGRLSSVMYASADTTFYILALYFGSVGIKKTRYAASAGLLADLAGIVTAIFVSYFFFG